MTAAMAAASDAFEPILEAARLYRDIRWCPIPVLYADKAPGWNGRRQSNWASFRLNGPQDERHFKGLTNIGILVGPASDHLVDVDLDCQEAVELAPYFLAPTWTFGRAGKPRSHYLYRAVGAVFEKFVEPLK